MPRGSDPRSPDLRSPNSDNSPWAPKSRSQDEWQVSAPYDYRDPYDAERSFTPPIPQYGADYEQQSALTPSFNASNPNYEHYNNISYPESPLRSRPPQQDYRQPPHAGSRPAYAVMNEYGGRDMHDGHNTAYPYPPEVGPMHEERVPTHSFTPEVRPMHEGRTLTHPYPPEVDPMRGQSVLMTPRHEYSQASRSAPSLAFNPSYTDYNAERHHQQHVTHGDNYQQYDRVTYQLNILH